MPKRNIFLESVPVEEALDKYLSALKDTLTPKFETIDVTDSLGRITEKAIYAKYSSPMYNSAAMDGIAVVTDKTKGASENTPIILAPKNDFMVIDTGDPINPPYDGVIMVEDIITLDDGSVKIFAAASPWQHVRPVGEDIVAGEMILPSNHKIRPIDIGVLLSGGITQIQVYSKPSVAIFPTGTEIIEPHIKPEKGDIIESNTRMFEAMVTENGASATRFAPVADDYNILKDAISKAVDNHDMVIINAGSSAGTEDYTASILKELGEVIIHGVAMKPGKPVVLAVVKGKPVIGTPGYPVSAFLSYENFVEPVLFRLMGQKAPKPLTIKAVSSRRMVSSLKHREYVRVKVGDVGGKLIASPTARGAGAAMSLVRADGFCVIPQNSEGVEAGEEVSVELFRTMEEIHNTLVSIGSHDLILDVLSDLIFKEYDIHLASTHVGSMAGLMALKREETHIAPIHLLDENTGNYNVDYIKRLFPDTPMAIIRGVGRTQGLIVQKGNPLGIEGISDLAGRSYINRQRGAGTRILFDYQLGKLGIDPETIKGYKNEATTHMAVAAAVESGSADAGMGILSAAKALDLSFVTVGSEQYDFALSQKTLEHPFIKVFIKVLTSEEFKNTLDELSGYTYENVGEIELI